MFRDEFISGGARAGHSASSYHEQKKEVAKILKERARIRTILNNDYRNSGSLVREDNYLSGNGHLYEITTGAAQVVIEIMEAEEEIITGRVNLMGRKPIKI